MVKFELFPSAHCIATLALLLVSDQEINTWMKYDSIGYALMEDDLVNYHCHTWLSFYIKVIFCYNGPIWGTSQNVKTSGEMKSWPSFCRFCSKPSVSGLLLKWLVDTPLTRNFVFWLTASCHVSWWLDDSMLSIRYSKYLPIRKHSK
jgi:hypothetical protein